MLTRNAAKLINNRAEVSENINSSCSSIIETLIMPNENKLNINIALKIIPEFCGDRKTFHKFVSCCDIMNTELTSPADQMQLVHVITSKLSGTAYDITKHTQFLNWPELRTHLQSHYLETRSVAQLQSELINSRQKSNECVRDFANNIEQILNDLNDACIASEGIASAAIIKNLNTKSAFQAFVEGLSHPYKLIIKASRFDNLKDAISAACEEERVHKTRLSNTPKTNLDKFGKSTLKCNFCKKMGHSEEKCYSKRNNQSPLPSFPKREIKTEVNMTRNSCAYCKKDGHHIRDCFKKKRADEIKRQSETPSTVPGNSPAAAVNPPRNTSRVDNL